MDQQKIPNLPVLILISHSLKVDLKFADLQHFWHTVFPCQYCVHNQHFLNLLYIHPCNFLMHNHTGQIQPNIFLLFVTFFSHCGKLWNANLLSYMSKNQVRSHHNILIRYMSLDQNETNFLCTLYHNAPAKLFVRNDPPL